MPPVHHDDIIHRREADRVRADLPQYDRAGKPMTAWRQPVVWLGAAVFLASVIGCVVMIVLAGRHDDPAAGAGVEYLLKMPVNRLPAEPGAGPGSR